MLHSLVARLRCWRYEIIGKLRKFTRGIHKYGFAEVYEKVRFRGCRGDGLSQAKFAFRFFPDSEGEATPTAVCDFVENVSASDGNRISIPEYVRAIPGGLKNAIDWMGSRFEVIGRIVTHN